MSRIMFRGILGVVSLTLILAANYHTQAHRLSDTKPQQEPVVTPSGIRLATPVIIPCTSPQPNCSKIRMGIDIASCYVPATLGVVLSGFVPPVSVSIIGPDGRPVNVSPLNYLPNGSAEAQFTASQVGTYTAIATDSMGCRVTCATGFTACCSLIKKTWSKQKPKFNGQKRLKTIRSTFSAEPPLIVGVENERSLIILDSAASCILNILQTPGGAPSALPNGFGDKTLDANTCQTSPPFSNLFENGLLGETITLSLNTRLDNTFPGIKLCNTMMTRKAINSGGILGYPFSGDEADPNDPGRIFTIPQSVLLAIAPGSPLELAGKFKYECCPILIPAYSVERLRRLANLALAGESTGGVSLVDINAAVSTVNSIFDQCRFLISCVDQRSTIKIAFDPTPAHQSSQPCGGRSPAWDYTATLTETFGVGITITKFTWDFYNGDGDNIGTQTNTGGDFAAFFGQCGIGNQRIAPFGRACASLCVQLDGLNSGSLIMTFYGTDDNGNMVSFASDRLPLLGP